MITTILLLIIGLQIHPPIIYYVLLIAKAMIDAIAFGIQIGDASK